MNEITVACLCDPNESHPPNESRHLAGDVVRFRETIDFRTAAIARKSIAWLKSEDPDAGVPEILAMLSEFYLLHCIESWTLCDAKGKGLEVNKANVRAYVLAKSDVAFTLADFADDLYTEQVLLPLVATVRSSSPPTPTGASTSATNGSGGSPKRSRRSSTASTPTVATAPI